MCAVFSTAKDLVSKKLSVNMDPGLSTLASFSYAIPLYLVLLAGLYALGLENFALGANFLLFVFVRSVTDIGAEWFKIKAITAGDVSLVSLFIALRPAFLIFLSPLITGDAISNEGIVAILITVSGCVLLVWKGQMVSWADRDAIMFALFSALCFCFNDCFDRLAVQQASAPLAAFAMTALSAFFVYLILAVRRVKMDPLLSNVKLLSIRGVFEITSMLLKLFALQFAPATTVATIVRMNLVFSVLGGGFVFKEKDTMRRLLAALMILSGSIGVVWFG